MFADWVETTRGYFSGWKWRSARRRGIRVFRYHGVVEQKSDRVLDRNQHLLSVFRAQMDYLRRFRVIGMAELMAELGEAPSTDRRPTAMVTFDDGFFNNLLAAEVLSHRRIPWGLFVPSGEVGPRRTMWSVEVSLLLLRGRADQVTAFDRTWPLRTRQEREESFRVLRAKLKAVPAPLRVETISSLREQFPAGESDRLLEEFPWLRMLTWEELEGLAAGGAEIGSHGLHHEIHHADQPAQIRERELVASRVEIERLVGRPCRTFAFPNGNFVDTSAREVEQAGYELAFTTETGTLEGKTRAQRFLLPRLSAPSSLHGFVRSFWWNDRATRRRPQASMARRSEA
jgi:peptidoglycan/xylan/chitin deacetylase (PgdA/CDA1 family)